MKKPNFFIIGAPKCGTSSLRYWLHLHPRIHMSTIKEPHYFDVDFTSNKVRDLKSYEYNFHQANDSHLAVGEASTNYLYSQVAVQNILNYAPEAKFIVMVRNPIQMAYSLHHQEIFNLNETIKDFEQAWNLQTERKTNQTAVPIYTDVKKLLYGERCFLGQQIERLYAQVDKKRVLVVLLDDMMDNPRLQYQRVLEFLEVPDDHRMDFPVRNESKATKLVFIDWILQAGRYLASKRLIPQFGAKIGRKIKLKNVKKQTRAPLSLEISNQLKLYFREDIMKLSKLLNRDLSKWYS